MRMRSYMTAFYNVRIILWTYVCTIYNWVKKKITVQTDNTVKVLLLLLLLLFSKGTDEKLLYYTKLFD